MKPAAAACLAAAAAVAAAALGAGERDAAKYDENMALRAVDDGAGVLWIDGRDLPLEGKAYDDVDEFYDRLPKGLSTNVNAGVRALLHCSAGMQFRFRAEANKLRFRWKPRGGSLSMDHMPASGVSGIDVYRRGADGRWRYVKTGRIQSADGGALDVDWTPGDECIVDLPLYNGVSSFRLGVDRDARVSPAGPRRSGVEKPVVFYGTSITQGGCCSRPGVSFVNLVGRALDVPVVNLGFSGSGVMDLELADVIARIDASCYVLDCVWNMRGWKMDRFAPAYESFVRRLRELRPGVPIVLAEKSDVYCGPRIDKDDFVRDFARRLSEEGWKGVVYLPRDGMYDQSGEGSVDGIHPNDLGMATMARAYGGAVREALGLRKR